MFISYKLIVFAVQCNLFVGRLTIEHRCIALACCMQSNIINMQYFLNAFLTNIACRLSFLILFSNLIINCYGINFQYIALDLILI